MKKTILAAAIFSIGSVFATSASADVITTIKPLGFIASAIANGVTGTHVIVTGNQSPHTYNLKPHDLYEIKEADLFVYINDDMEISIGQALKNPAYRPAHILELGDLPEIKKFLVQGVDNDGDEHEHEHHHHHHGDADHDHDHDHGHMDKDEHDHDHDHMDKDHDHDHDHMDKDHDHDHDHMDKDHDHDHDHMDKDHGHGHHHAPLDPNAAPLYGDGTDTKLLELETNYHIWTSPKFAMIIADNIAKQLTAIYPDKKALIQQNLAQFKANLDKTVAQVQKIIVPSKMQNYIVYHDAYTYFEKDFGFRQNDKGALYINVSVPPSIKQLSQLHALSHRDHIKYIFSEPQFNKEIAEKMAHSMHAKVGYLDPLGSNIQLGPNSYDQFILSLANEFSKAMKK